MLRAMSFGPRFGQGFRRAMSHPAPVGATIRRTDRGVRIKFSDGRISWFDREGYLSDQVFMGAVISWAKRHGVQDVQIEFE